MRPEVALQRFKYAYDSIKKVKLGREFILDPAQALALNARMPGKRPYEIVMLNAGQGAGKTFFAPIWMFAKAWLYHQRGLDVKRPFEGYMGGPDGPHLEQVLRPRLIECFGEPGTVDLFPLFGHIKLGNSPTSACVHLNPSFCRGNIYFRHMKEGLKIQGRHMNALLIDEVDIGSAVSSLRISEEVWEALKQRTRRFEREVLFTTTPYRQGWVYYEVYLPAKKVQFEVYFRNSLGQTISHEEWLKKLSSVYSEARLGHATARKVLENLKSEWVLNWDLKLKSVGTEPFLVIIYPNILSPYYPVEAHLEAYLDAVEKRTLDEFRMKMMGEWVVPDVLVFKNFSADCIISDLPPLDNKVKVGVDFGFGESASALVFVSRTNENPPRWVVLAGWQGHEPPSDTARRLMATIRREGWTIDEISFDAMGLSQKYRTAQAREEATVAEQFIRTLESEGVDRRLCRGVLATRAESFGYLIRVVNQKRLLVHGGVPVLRTQLGTMEHTDIGGKTKRAHSFHMVDALRIAIYNTEATEEREQELMKKKDTSLNPRVGYAISRFGHRGRRSERARTWAQKRRELGI